MKKPKRRIQKAARKHQVRRPAKKAPAAPPAAAPEVPANQEWELTPAQYDFCLHYARTYNGRQSYLAAHPEANEATADTESWRLLTRHAKVKRCLAALFESGWASLEASAQEVIGRIGAASRADIALLFDEKGKVLPPSKWPAWMRHAVKSFDGAKVTLVDPLAVYRMVLEITGRLKNPEHQAADALAEALKRTLKEHAPHRLTEDE